ncbi:MAG: alpha/beta hydrolase [Chloroflexi bacterium]|nr:alpha/beta hydrolase [Chloroflexota bacterium]
MNPFLPEDKYLSVNGLRLHYLDWGGDKTRKPFILMHGIGGNAHAFDTFTPHFIESHHILAIDGRGHGDSDWSREGYAAQQMADDIAAFAVALGAYPFDYYGHSLGSRVGMPLGAYHSQLVDHLVLGDYGPMPDPSPAGRETAQRRLVGSARPERPRGFFTPQQAFDWHRGQNETATDAEIWQTVKYTYRTNWDGILAPKTDPEISWLNGRTGLKEGPFLWDCVASLTCKTLVLRGETSTVLDRKQAEEMVARMPNGKGVFKEVPGAGHGLHRENMEGAVAIIKEFLGS